jgi:hypothetical protein
MSSEAQRRNWLDHIVAVSEGRSSSSDNYWITEYTGLMDKIASSEVDRSIINLTKLCAKLSLNLSQAKAIRKRRQLYEEFLVYERSLSAALTARS